MNEEKKDLLNQISMLDQEHRDLDDVILRLQEQKTINLQQMQRLKKKKLLLKDKIQSLEAVLSSYTTDTNYGAEDRAASYFEHLGKIYDECFPIKTKKIHNKTLSKPWINQELQRLINKKNKLFSKKLHKNTPENVQKYKECKKDLAHKRKISKETYFRNKLMSSSNNMKDKWDAIRIIINKKKKNNARCPINNRILGNHYSSVARKLIDKLPSTQNDTQTSEE